MISRRGLPVYCTKGTVLFVRRGDMQTQGDMRKNVGVVLALFLMIIIPFAIKMSCLDRDLYKGGDDSWWHFRHVNEIVETGRRPDVDRYEFATLSRNMVYPPLLHYIPAYLYTISGFGYPLIIFLSYFVFLEGALCTLLIYFVSFFMTKDKMWSLIAALASVVVYGVSSDTYSGVFLPQAMANIFGFCAMLGALSITGRVGNNTLNKVWYSSALASGLMLGCAFLTWAGSMYVYLPVVVFLFAQSFFTKKSLRKESALFFGSIGAIALALAAIWYWPVVVKYGLHPYSPDIYSL